MSLIGQTLGGRYQIQEQLGEGGMATVYKAADSKLPRFVAVKIIRTDRPLGDKAMARFKHEAETLARLSHTNIVPVLDYGEHEEMPYLVMPYLPGGTLRDRMKSAMPPQEAARILVPIAQALSHAHHKNIIHRDVKPSNIIFNEDGAPMLSDFGIVKVLDDDSTQELTTTGMSLGTPAYMAPEQVLGKTPDPRADVYALGVVFYELVTGRKPYVEDTPMALAAKQALEPPPHPRQFNPALPENVDNLLMTALANQPERRFGNMDAFANALRSVSGGDFTPTPLHVPQQRTPAPTPTPYPTQGTQPVGAPPQQPAYGGYGWSQPSPQAGQTRTEDMFQMPGEKFDQFQGPYPPQKKSRTGLWIGLGVLGLALVAGLIILIVSLSGNRGTGSQTGNSGFVPVTEALPTATSTQQQISVTTATVEIPVTVVTAPPIDPSLTPETGPTEMPYFTDSYGSSVLGRELGFSCAGSGYNTLLLVGGIHGDEPNTIGMIYELESAFYYSAAIPAEWKICFVYDMNPDGSSSDNHFNSNGADLNRNWSTADWVRDITRADGTVYAGGGGYSAFSEPETSNLVNLIQSLESEGWVVTVFYHSTQTSNSDVRPAYYGELNWDSTSDYFAGVFNAEVGYTYNRASSSRYTGESLQWCGENGYTCFGVEMPNGGSYSSSDVDRHLAGLLSLIASTY